MPKPLTKNRLIAVKRQKGRCFYCDFPMWIGKPTEFIRKFHLNSRGAARFQCTAEHLVAKQDGGTNTRHNIVAACRFCNHTRHKISSPPDPKNYHNHVMHRLKAGKWHPSNLRQLLIQDG